LFSRAEESVRRRLKSLRREYRRLRGSKLSASLVTLDVETGAVLAYVLYRTQHLQKRG